MDRLLTADELAERLGMKTDWVWAQAPPDGFHMFASAGTGAFESPLSKPGSTISRRAAQHQDLRRTQHRCAVARSQPLAGTTGHRAGG
jgi:hypothetical protein